MKVETINATTLVEPVAKGRPRMAVIGKHVRAYTPSKTRKTEDMIIADIRHQLEKYSLSRQTIPFV